MLQALNILENFDVKSMGYNSSRYIHAILPIDEPRLRRPRLLLRRPYFPPEEPIKGLLSKDYAKQRARQINWEKNDPTIGPGDPYPFQGQTANPYRALLEKWNAPTSNH